MKASCPSPFVSILLRLVVIHFLAASGTAVVNAQGPMNNGFTYTGTIAPSGHSDSWTFSANSGDAIVIGVGDITASNGFAPRIRLYNPASVLLGTGLSQPKAAEIAVTATNTGTFTVVVDDGSGPGTNIGTYRLTLAKTGSPVVIAPGESGGPLVNGSTFTGTIELGGLDVWTLSATNGQTIIVGMGRTTNTLTPYLRLYDPSGALLSSFGSGATAAQVSFRATNTGTFTVVASDNSSFFSGSGSYQLSLAQTGPPVIISPGQSGGPLTNGSTFTGTIGLGLLNVWTLSATSNQTIIVGMGRTTNTLTSYLRLYDPSGALLDSFGASGAAQVSFRATNTGTFTVVAGDNSSFYSGSGSYQLSLAQTGPPVIISPGQQGGALTNGSTFTGTIGLGLMDVWTLSATNGQTIIVGMGRTTNTLTSYLRLYDPSGALLDSFGTAAAAQVSFRATNTGTFTVVAGDNSSFFSGSGSYQLSLAQTGPPVIISPGQEGGPLTNGSTFTGNIGLGLLNVWTLSATNGQTIIVSMGDTTNAETLSPYLRLYDPSGVSLASFSAGSAAEVSVQATNTGTFTLVAGDNSSFFSGSGPYQLSLAQTGPPVIISPGQTGGPLTNGSTFTGTIGLGLLNVWTLSATNGQTIIVSMGRTTNTETLSPYLRLYDPSGVLLSSFSAGSAAEVSSRATNTGTFTLVAGDNGSFYSGSGPYQLSLAQTGSPVFISAGEQGGSLTGLDMYNGTISLGLLDEWTFTACAGTPISLQMTRTTNTLTPYIRLYDRTGNLMSSLTQSPTATINTTAPTNGLYTVVLGDNGSFYSGSGGYTFTVNGLSSGLKLCEPIVSGTNVHVSGVGGTNSGTFEILAATNVATAKALWTPVFTNQFDTFGTFTFSNLVDPAYNQRFFLIREP